MPKTFGDNHLKLAVTRTSKVRFVAIFPDPDKPCPTSDGFPEDDSCTCWEAVVPDLWFGIAMVRDMVSAPDVYRRVIDGLVPGVVPIRCVE